MRLKANEIYLHALADFLNETGFRKKWTGRGLTVDQLEEFLEFDEDKAIPMNPHLVFPLKWLDEIFIDWKPGSKAEPACKTARQLFNLWSKGKTKSP